MKVYVVCEVDVDTEEYDISRVQEVFSNRENAIARAIVLLQDSGNSVRYTEEYKNLTHKIIEEYIDKFGEFYDRDFEVAVFERTVDPFN